MSAYQALEQFRIFAINIANIYVPSYLLGVLVIFGFSLILVQVVKFDNYLLVTRSFLHSIVENLYLFVLDVLKQNIGIRGTEFFPLMFNVFFFIYFVNLNGLIGFNIQLTSHIIVTFTISISLFIGIIALGLYLLRNAFIHQFIPKDAPKALFPLLVVIESISYIIRPFTLGIRLFANMFSGHVLLFVISSFLVVIIEKQIIILKVLLFVFPVVLFFFIMCLEILIMFLQAYVFIILLCVYLKDSIKAHV